MSASADSVFSTSGILPALDAWMGVLAFSGQIFFDFAGYSTCAIGAAACLGFILPQNFLYPYAAIGFSDFWRRWHITLSAWLRDYLYIPLGGNQKGKIKTYINLMITMLLGGLWHGANWTFVVWGGLHGFYLWVEKFFKDLRTKKSSLAFTADSNATAVMVDTSQNKTVKNFILALLTFFLINVTWVFFRAADFTTAWNMLGSMFGLGKSGAALLTTLAITKVAVITSLMVLFHWFMRNTNILSAAYKLPWWIMGIIWAVILLLLILSQESSSCFIYFQF
ncbi:MAG: MBOAT family O-acyltransferase [Chitinophagaceae bacterium]